MKPKTKIKTENDLIGFLIASMDEEHNISAEQLNALEIDKISIETMLNALVEKHWAVTTFDNIYLTSLGINNYVTIKDKAIRVLLIGLKEVIFFAAGILSGVLVTWFVTLLNL